ncbi:hypothetical protein Efla_007483 [Eimeria flavescens]
MKGRRENTTLGAGALVTLAALAALLQQRLTWLAFLLFGFVLHFFWFWRRVLLPSHHSAPNTSSSSSSSSSSKVRRRHLRRGEASGGGLRPRLSPRGSVSSTAEGRGGPLAAAAAEEAAAAAAEEAAANTSADTTDSDLWGATGGASDSADEADSEVEQESLFPAAERRQRLPRRMSVASFNLAAGCFPPEAKVLHHVVTTCLYTPNLPPTSTVFALIQNRLLKSVPVLSPFYPRWREVSVHVASHVRRLSVSNASELHLCLEWISSQPCDPSLPRWQVWLLENAAAAQQQQQQQGEEGEAAAAEVWDSRDYCSEEERLSAPSRHCGGPPRHCIVVRAEHALGDGVSLIEACSPPASLLLLILLLLLLLLLLAVGMRLFCDEKGVPLNEWEKPPILTTPATAAAELCQVPSPTALLLKWTKVLLRAPRRVAEALHGGCLLLFGVLRVLLSVLFAKPDACSPITGAADERRRRTWCARTRSVFLSVYLSPSVCLSVCLPLCHFVALGPSVCLAAAKKLKTAAAATLNDVFLAAFARAFRRYCELQGDGQFAEGTDCVLLPRVLLACAFFRRTRELPDESQLLLRNRFTLSSLELPVNAGDGRETLRRVKQATSALKASRLAAADFLCQKVLGQLLPLQFTRKAVEDRFKTHSVVFSNLPAFTAPVYLCGSKVTEVQVEVVSYAGRVYFSLTYDPSVVREGHLIPSLFFNELKRLAAELGVPFSHADGGESLESPKGRSCCSLPPAAEQQTGCPSLSPPSPHQVSPPP